MSTSRVSDGSESAVDLVGAGAGVPGGRARAEHRPQVVGPTGPAAASCRCPRRRGRSCARAAPPARSGRRELGRAQRGQVRGQRADARSGMSPGSRARRRARAPRSGPRPVRRGHARRRPPPAPRPPRGRRSPPGRRATSGQASAAAAVSSAKASASRAAVAVVRRSEAGLGTASRLTGSTRHQRRLASSTRSILPAALDTGRGGREDVGPGPGRAARVGGEREDKGRYA